MNNKTQITLIRISKRTFDVVSSIVLLLIFAPFVPVIALLIKLSSPGPIIYKQLRIGEYKNDKVVLFEMMKFRTMYQDAEQKTGATWAKKEDPRITPIGSFLRKSRLDEIPQILNVLKGEMSLIGPRPERPGFYQKLESAIPFFSERTFRVRPGITGLAQVNQGYDTCIDDVKRKVAYDHSYSLCLSSFTLWLKTDLNIIFKTLFVMVMGRGQ